MKLLFKGGLWDGVELDAKSAPEEIRLRALGDGQGRHNIPIAERDTVDLSKLKDHVYLLDALNEEQRVVYKYCEG